MGQKKGRNYVPRYLQKALPLPISMTTQPSSLKLQASSVEGLTSHDALCVTPTW